MMPIQAMRLRSNSVGYAAAVLADSPLGFWRLNDAHAAATYADSSGNARNLAKDASATIRSGLGALFSGSLGCVEGDGETSLASNTDSAFVITGDLTFECVVCFQSLPATGAQWCFASCTPTAPSELSVDNYLYFLGLQNTGGTIRLFFFHENGSGTNNTVTTNWTPTVGVPYHIVITRDTAAQTYEAWVNGSSLGATSAYTNNPTGGGASDFALFGVLDIAQNSRFQGLMAEAAIYNTKLSSGRIAAHYAALGSPNSMPTTYQGEVLADSPYSFWHMNGGTTGLDQGSGANTLTGSGVTAGATGLNTHSGKAWTFGSGDTGTVSSSAGFQYTGDITFECLVNFSSTPSSGTGYQFVQCNASGETEATNTLLQIALNNTAGTLNLAWFHENGAGNNNSGSINWTPSTGVTYHVAAVRDNGANTYEFYVDGVSLGTSGFTNDPTGGTSDTFRVGSAFDGSSTLIGTLDEVALYKTALSSARIAAHYAAL